MTTTTEADLLVVGCGPVGVMCALRSAQRGMNVVALDRTPEVYPLPRAIGMDEEIQRLFQDAGLLDELRAHSTPLLGAEFVDASGARVVGFDLEPGTLGRLGQPPMTMFDQPGVERFLRAAAESAGVTFRFGLEAVGVDPAPPAPSIMVRATDGSQEQLGARWVVAADGASSTVRKLLDIRLEDHGFDQNWLVIDVTVLDDDLDMPRVARQICDPARIVTLVPGHADRRRWEFRLHDDEGREQALDPDFIEALLSPWGSPAQLRVDRSAMYRFHATVAERFQHGSVVLAGDAAHQMPPFNGQGMCAGLRDAENLSWKLALVNSGAAREALLESYDAERRPHAAGQVAHSADAGRLIEAIASGRTDDVAAGYGGGRPFPHLEHGFVDGEHPAVGRPLAHPSGATSLDELLGSGFALVSSAPVSDPAVERWDRLGARCVVLDPTALPDLLEPETTVIVRPDRYVAAVTADLSGTSERLLALT